MKTRSGFTKILTVLANNLLIINNFNEFRVVSKTED